jgi:hypothetical protein
VIQRRTMATLVLTASAVLGGCGFQAPAVTTHEHNSVQANDFQVGAVRVRDGYVTSVQTGAKPAVPYLVVTLVNDSPSADTLTGITSSLGTVTLTGAGVLGGTLRLPAKGVPVSIDQPLLSPSGPNAVFQPASATLPGPGSYVPVQLTFSTAGTSPSEQLPVVPPTETTAVATPVPDVTATPPSQPGEPASD